MAYKVLDRPSDLVTVTVTDVLFAFLLITVPCETESHFSFCSVRDERELLLAIARSFDQSPSTTVDE